MSHNHIGGVKCEVCGCSDGEIIMHSRCHPNAPTWASLNGDLLKIECAECNRVICYFVVASEPLARPPLPKELAVDDSNPHGT